VLIFGIFFLKSGIINAMDESDETDKDSNPANKLDEDK